MKNMIRKMKRMPHQLLRNIIQLWILTFIHSPVSALFAFEQLQIDPTELYSSTVCDVVTSGDLLAYHCASSFKVFNTATETPTMIVYQTTKAVA